MFQARVPDYEKGIRSDEENGPWDFAMGHVGWGKKVRFVAQKKIVDGVDGNDLLLPRRGLDSKAQAEGLGL